MAPPAIETRSPMAFGRQLIPYNNKRGCDEPDNKTTELASFINLNKLITMNDAFCREDERLKTFHNWPLEWLDKAELAQTGMFFTGEHDKVKCYFCEVEIGTWEREDRPVPEHLRWSPNCPLLRRRTTNNVPISAEALDRLLPPMSFDICGANDSSTEVRPFAYPEGAPRLTSTATSTNTRIPMGPPVCPTSSTYFPEFPEYALETARMRSYAEWPRSMKQKPTQLAEAGFFYTGVGDRVKCFSCGGGLMDWDESDEPWEQHALWLNKCRFLKLIKGQNYIDSVLEKQKAKLIADQTKSEEPEEDTKASDNRSSEAVPPEFKKAIATTITPTVIAANTQNEALQTAVAAIEQKPASSNIAEEKLCKICYAGEYNTAFLPCGHVVACAKCASSVTKCPLCRKPFTDVMRVYFS